MDQRTCLAPRMPFTARGAPCREISVSHWKLNEDSRRIRRIYTTHCGRTQKLAVVILPPSMGVPSGSNPKRERLCRWLKARYADGTALCSVCAGAFLLAETGLLDGRTATTHWSHAEEMERRFPKIKIETQKLLIDHGDIFTAGGVMAWLDLGLRWIEKLMSPTVMLGAATLLRYRPAAERATHVCHFLSEPGFTVTPKSCSFSTGSTPITPKSCALR
jgi:transcriptional regulator GlxA family with amidase domain